MRLIISIIFFTLITLTSKANDSSFVDHPPKPIQILFIEGDGLKEFNRFYKEVREETIRFQQNKKKSNYIFKKVTEWKDIKRLSPHADIIIYRGHGNVRKDSLSGGFLLRNSIVRSEDFYH